MKGDFTRDTFDPLKHFSRVLMQQGRVTLDADHNEQVAILLHYLRTLVRDIIGPYAGPVEDNGFTLSYDQNAGLKIGAGRYYVDGILVENDGDCSYSAQPGYNAQPYYQVPDDDPLLKEIKSNGTGQVFWVYLDVWERCITPIEDDAIREKALDDRHTCARAKVVWQVKGLPADSPTPEYGSAMACEEPLAGLVSISKASLAARVDPGMKTEDPCITPPASKYRGAENHLYRVEIHRGSKDKNGEATTPTFKWSRDNGSVATAWLGTSGADLKVSNTRGFEADNWVELLDDDAELLGAPGTLVKLAKVDGDTLSVGPGTTLPARSDDSKHPKVRRWDHFATDVISLADDNAVPIQESPENATPEQIVWVDLEDGVQIQFCAGGEYRTGDYWLIPARVATGDVEWPSYIQDGKMIRRPLPPHGVEHHYAPLGFVQWPDDKKFTSCQCEFEPLSSCFSMGSIAVGAHLLRPTARPPQAAPAAKPARKRKRQR